MACTDNKDPLATQPALPESVSLFARLSGFAILIAGAAVLLWLLAIALSATWLAYQVPVTAADLAQASWLPSYVTATHFSGALAWAVACSLLLVGLALGITKQTIAPGLSAVVLACGVLLNSEQLMVRIGIATDTVKVGCFVSETKECRRMLGLPDNFPSRYLEDGKEAPWYVAEREKVVTARPVDIAQQSMPGWALLNAPRFVFDAPKINAKLKQQRAALAALKTTASAATP